MSFASSLLMPEFSSLSRFPRSQKSPFPDFICDRIPIGSESRVLDIGCREGANALDIATRTGARLIGVDEDPALVRKAVLARRYMEEDSANAVFFAECPETLPFSERTFDVVYCDRFQDTANDPEVLARSMAGLVKDDGAVVLSYLYLRRDAVDCHGELGEWLGEANRAPLLSDLVSLFEAEGMVLEHFQPMDDYLSAYVESMFWSSMLESGRSSEGAWGNRLSRTSACSLLKAIDEREIGYAALLLRREG